MKNFYNFRLRDIITIFSLILLFSFFVITYTQIFSIYEFFNNVSTEIVAAIVGSFITISATQLIQRMSNSNLAIAYNVAMIGFPQSGKTTLITSIFNEILERKIEQVDVTLTSESTINRLNQHTSRLQQGYALLPTGDNEIFSYRADLVIQQFLSKSVYQIQIGDFPGEDTKQYLENYGSWLHTTPFFKWANTADAIIFVVDLEMIAMQDELERVEYISGMSAAVRAAWQHLLLDNLNERTKTRRKPVVLAFAKADLLLSSKARDVSVKNLNNTDEDYTSKVPEIIYFSDASEYTDVLTEVEDEFDSLITFLKGACENFEVVFTSSFVKVDQRVLGVQTLLNSILPKRGLGW